MRIQNAGLLVLIIFGLAFPIAWFGRLRQAQREVPRNMQPVLLDPFFSNAFEPSSDNIPLNDESLAFVEWTQRTGAFCYVVPDTDGVIRKLELDVCCYPTDEQIEVVARLSGLQDVSFRGKRVTDEALRLLASNTSMKKIHVYAAVDPFSDAVVDEVIRIRPELRLHLPRYVQGKEGREPTFEFSESLVD